MRGVDASFSSWLGARGADGADAAGCPCHGPCARAMARVPVPWPVCPVPLLAKAVPMKDRSQSDLIRLRVTGSDVDTFGEKKNRRGSRCQMMRGRGRVLVRHVVKQYSISYDKWYRLLRTTVLLLVL
jgi:hypothetical protein